MFGGAYSKVKHCVYKRGREVGREGEEEEEKNRGRGKWEKESVW